MRSVGVKVLKNRLSEYVRLAAGGETVLITDRNRVVAEIVPPQAGRSPLLADRILARSRAGRHAGQLRRPAACRGARPSYSGVQEVNAGASDLRAGRT
jgi:antitoxin (DNA-binding transcriptional repressor) of toxin-antitoxin stability system